MNEPTPVVYVVDDDREVTDSLNCLIESVGYTCQCFNSASEFFNTYKPGQPGCLILDVRMPSMSGLELQDLMEKEKINLPIIFITGHGDIPMAVQAMRNGACDFLTKPVRGQLLLDSINKAIRKHMQLIVKRSRNSEYDDRLGQLTQREREILDQIIAGKLTKTIAQDLQISPNTVNVHRSNVMKKMGVKSLAELVGLALASHQIEV